MGLKVSLKGIRSLWGPQVVREGIPQTGSSRTESSVSHGWQISSWRFEGVGLSGAKEASGGVGGEEFLEILRGCAIEAVVG